MRKMYFAMIPKKSAAESLLTAAAVCAAAYFGAKLVLGDEKLDDYKKRASDIFKPSDRTPDASRDASFVSDESVPDDFEDAEEALPAAEARQEDILERIRRASGKGDKK